MHQTVLLAETLEYLAPADGGWWADLTVGGGGHTEALLRATGPSGRVLGLDRDGEILEAARRRLAGYGERLVLVRENFRRLEPVLQSLGIPSLSGIVMDLGVSSLQLDTPERGFSFQQDGPLDMRMDPTGELTAADLVNHADEPELARIFYEYGEERRSRALARRVAKQRPFQTTRQLADVAAAVLGRAGRIHPATRMFQALRIAVNDELGSLRDALAASGRVLRPGGRLVVISFHSLEDRPVKQALRAPLWLRLTKHVVRPGEAECRANPRARSAKLRAAQKADQPGGGID